MNTHLEEAFEASRDGRREEAYRLLALVLKDDPRNVAAWYQLSTTVDAPDQQRTFLQKVLALDPHHADAQQRLAALDSPAAPTADEAAGEPLGAVELTTETTTTTSSEDLIPPEPGKSEAEELTASDDLLDFLEQADSDAIPDWLAAEEPDLAVEMPAVSLLEDEPAEPAQAEAAEPLPQWLLQDAGLGWIEASDTSDDNFEALMARTRGETPAAPAPRPAGRATPDRVNMVLTGLIATAIVVLVVLWYFIIRFYS